MPDTDATGFLSTLGGEQAHRADALRREAIKLRAEANAADQEAERHEQRAAWAHEAVDALMEKRGEDV